VKSGIIGTVEDLYRVLGLEKTATHDQIKLAYLARAAELHPDHGGEPDEFAALDNVYQVLGDPVILMDTIAASTTMRREGQ
jgi:curved DNA-binding protein CbpA